MHSYKGKILIADDEQEIRDILELLLVGEGYEVVVAKNGGEAVKLADESIDLFILDVNMPEKSGFVVASELRKKYLVPLLFLTAYLGESDKTLGYSVGADDYITKPFSNSELLLKVKAFLRRSKQYQTQVVGSKENEKNHCLSFFDLTVDLDKQMVLKDKETIRLTHTEFKILELLLTNRKKIFSIENIYRSVWQDHFVADSAVMVHIKNLRKKLGQDTNMQYIKTAWGKGYYIE